MHGLLADNPPIFCLSGKVQALLNVVLATGYEAG
jgi:hypothetical protein